MKTVDTTTSENTQEFAEKANNKNYSSENKELIAMKRVENTPFTIIGDDDGEAFITMGNYRLTEGGKTHRQLERIIKDKNWDFITGVIAVMVETTVKIVNNNKN